MPLLELSDASFATADARGDAAQYIGSVMLWPRPSDRDQREQWLEQRRLSLEFDNVEAHASAYRGDLPREFALQLVHWGRQIGITLPLAEMPEFNRGKMIGKMVGHMLGREYYRQKPPGQRGIPRRVNFDAVKSIVAKEYGRSVDSINKTDWPLYRTVGHFWAAFVARDLLNRKTGQRPAFPCATNHILDFLRTVEQIRKDGSNLVLPGGAPKKNGHKKAERLIRDDSSTWRIPTGLLGGVLDASSNT